MKRRLLIAAVCLTLIAACGGDAGDTTTTTAATDTTTESPSDTTSETTATTPATSTPEATATTTASSGEVSGDLASLQAAMARSADAQPSRVEGVISMEGMDTGTGQPGDVEMSMSVTTDATTGDTAMVMDFGAMAGAMGEEMPAEFAEMMGSMEMRQIGDTVYLKFPFFTALMGAETEWVSMPAEEGGGMAEELGSGAAPSDPASFLDSFSEAEGTVEELGPEEIRGINTTHYQIIVEEGWQDHLSAEELAELEEQGPLPSSSFPLDLWIDADGLVHRMVMAMSGDDVTDPTADDFESMSMTFDFFDFGESVSIEPPPADQVTDMEEMGGLFGGTAPTAP